MPPVGPHFNLESLSAAFLALSPQAVNNTTLPSAGAQSLGFDLAGFQGDVYLVVGCGALPDTSDITFALEDAPQDVDGTAPEAVDFAAVTDSDGNAVEVTFGAADDDTIKVVRVDRHLVRRWARIQCTNAAATAALCFATILGTLPAYEDQDSDRVLGKFTQFK